MKESSEINSDGLIITTEVMGRDSSVMVIKLSIGRENMEPIFRTTHYIVTKCSHAQVDVVDLVL